MKKSISGFTLVELIVVVTILAILATIGFVSYSSYLTGVRDTNRLAQLVSIHDGLALYSSKSDLPLPDDNIEVKVNVSAVDYDIGYQGYAGANTLETIDFTKGGQDPRDKQYFTYLLTKDRKHFQLMAFLEEEQNISSHILRGAHAVDYSDRIPTTYGANLGILTTDENLPIQEDPTLSAAGEILLNGAGTSYIAHINDDEALTGNGTNILYGAYVVIAGKSNKTCKTILGKHPYIFGTDGGFWISVGSDQMKTDCDMTTEGGGWTRVIHGNGADLEKYHAGYPISKWNADDSFIPPTSATSSMKLRDADINSLRGTEPYLIKGNHQTAVNRIYYIPASCTYQHKISTIAVGNDTCGDMFPNIGLTGQYGCVGAADKPGIGCYPPGGTDGVTFNFQNSIGPVCLSGGGCHTQTFGDTLSLGLYIR